MEFVVEILVQGFIYAVLGFSKENLAGSFILDSRYYCMDCSRDDMPYPDNQRVQLILPWF